MAKVTDIFLVRHGTTAYNREKRFRGRTGVSLDPHGCEQARAAAGALQDMDISAIYTSPLPRAVETGEIMGEALGILVIKEDGLIDVDYGSWQGLTVEEVKDKYGGKMFEGWLEDPGSFCFPQGECMSDMRKRLEEALLRLGGDNLGKAVAAVSHLAVLKTAYVFVRDIDYSGFIELPLDNGSVSHLVYRDGSLELRKWNFLERFH